MAPYFLAKNPLIDFCVFKVGKPQTVPSRTVLPFNFKLLTAICCNCKGDTLKPSCFESPLPNSITQVFMKKYMTAYKAWKVFNCKPIMLAVKKVKLSSDKSYSLISGLTICKRRKKMKDWKIAWNYYVIQSLFYSLSSEQNEFRNWSDFSRSHSD